LEKDLELTTSSEIITNSAIEREEVFFLNLTFKAKILENHSQSSIKISKFRKLLQENA